MKQTKIDPRLYSLNEKQLENFCAEYEGTVAAGSTAEETTVEFDSVDNADEWVEMLNSTFKLPPAPEPKPKKPKKT